MAAASLSFGKSLVSPLNLISFSEQRTFGIVNRVRKSTKMSLHKRVSEQLPNMDGKDNMWSWVILAMVTFLMFLVIGIIKGFSVLLPELTEQLGTHTWIIGSCISIISGWGYLIGMSASSLVQRFGARFCLMVCGTVSSLGLVVAACATSVYMLLVGLLLIGFLLLQENIAIGLVPEYFDKYFTTAVSIFSLGTAVGIMVVPVLTQVLLEIYGWRGALFLLSGLCMHSIPFAAIAKQRKVKKTDVKDSQPLLRVSNDIPAEESRDTEKYALKLLHAISKAFDTPLLTSLPFFSRVLVPVLVFGYVFPGWIIYIVSFAKSNGFSMRESSIIAACGGIGVAVIRLAVPFLNKLMTYKQLLYTSSFIMTTSLILTTLVNSLVLLNIASVMFGIGGGLLGTEIFIAARDIAEDKEYYNAVGWLHLIYGLATVVSGTFTGLIFDVTGSFTFSFAILATVSLLTAISLGLEEIWAGIEYRS